MALFTSDTAKQAGAIGKRGPSERTRLLNELLDSDKPKEIWLKLEEKAEAGDMDAIKTYLAYCFGKPKETMNLNLPAGINIIFKKVEQENNVHLLPMNGNGTKGN